VEKKNGKPIERSGPPPCWKCPKKSPEQAHQYELSKGNQELYNLYCKVKATSGSCLTAEQKASDWLSSRLALIEMIVEQDKQDRLVKQMSKILRATAGG
jgi:hypothetical protein